MNKHLIFVFGMVLSAGIFSSCKKSDKPYDPVAPTKGVYVLSEGNYSANNGKLAYRDAASGAVSGDFFVQQNPSQSAGLGDVANDILIYGSKMYIVVNVSNNVTVLDAKTGTFISRIPIVSLTGGRQPRYAASTKGKLYVTAYDGTVSVIDTTSLTVNQVINVGPNPEGILVYNNKLFVANSGGFNTVPDSTVSVIDLNTSTEIARLVVGVNPQQLAVNSAGDIYVTTYGNYTTIPASVTIINGNNNTVKQQLGSGYQFDHVRIYNDIAYFYNNYASTGTRVKTYDTHTGAVVRNEFITDGTSVTVVYGVDFDEDNGDVYICDAGNFSDPGKVTCFSSEGIRKFSFSVAPGINPKKTVFLR